MSQIIDIFLCTELLNYY